MDEYDMLDDSDYGQYDEDMDDSSQYCEHGRFIGSWWGPDYMCGYCEMGTTAAEYKLICFNARYSRIVNREATKASLLYLFLKNGVAPEFILEHMNEFWGRYSRYV